jgi:uncharacterized protein
MRVVLPGCVFTQRVDGLILRLRLTPRGGRDQIDGIETLADGQRVLKLRVKAPPAAGEANKAMLRLLAKGLGVPASAFVILNGETGRIKTVSIAGDGQRLARRLEDVLAKERAR